MILVTGGTGLVGAHLLYTLIDNNEEVRAIYRKTSDLNAVKKVFSYYTSEVDRLFNKIDWQLADITDVLSLEVVFKNVDYVYHCAAYISFNPRHFKTLKKVNVEGTANVVNLCISEKVIKLCYISSVASLGKTENESLITEECEFNPNDRNSAYSITKNQAEMEVWRGSQEGLEVVIVQPGVIIGEGIWSSASGGIFRTIAKGLKFYTPGGIGIVDVKDVVKVMIYLTKSKLKNQAYILVGENILYKKLLTKISNKLHRKAPKLLISKTLMLSFANFDWVLNKLFKTRRKLLKSTVRNLFKRSFYDSSKITTTMNFNFRDLDKTIERVAGNYRADFHH
jgi:nucleoside-diphosphate-sugar epimerase